MKLDLLCLLVKKTHAHSALHADVLPDGLLLDQLRCLFLEEVLLLQFILVDV